MSVVASLCSRSVQKTRRRPSRLQFCRCRPGRYSFAAPLGVLECKNTPEPPRNLLISMFICLFGFFVLGLLVMSTEIFSSRIDLNRRFLAVLVYDCLVTFLAFASFFFDSKDLIAASFVLDGGLDRRRQILHLDLRFFMFRLRRHAKGEASADYSCCNKVLRFHGYSYLTVVRLNLLKFCSLICRAAPRRARKVSFKLDRVGLGFRYASPNRFTIPFCHAPLDRARGFARSRTR